MNEHITIANRLCLLPGVSGMVCRSDRFYGPAVLVVFKNGYELSIVANPQFKRGMRYAEGKELEIAVFSPDNEFTREFFPGAYDDVLPFQNRAEILAIGELIANA